MVMKVALVLMSMSLVLSGSWLEDFTEGFAKGNSEPIDCLANPTHCLETVGRGLGLVSSGEWKHQINTLKGSVPNDANIALFFTGLVEGIMANPGTTNYCTSEIYTWIQLINMVASMDFSNMSIPEIVSVGCSVYTQFSDNLLDACNIPQLMHALQYLSLYDYLVSYLDNNCVVNAAFQAVMQCTTDLYDCGYSTGMILRLETGWSI